MNVRPYIACLPLFLLLVSAVCASCGGPAEKNTDATLTEDERYIVLLYMKITETRANLQDNPEEEGERWKALREEFDSERVQAAIDRLSEDPERWIAVYERIAELTKRRLDRERELRSGS